MPDRIRVACVQMTSRTDKAANLETAERLVARAGEAVDRARESRADDERRLPRDAAERVGRAKVRLLDEEGNDPPERRLEETAAEAV
ncbi:MAG TPA: hypothetical protein VNR63_04010 [Gaiellaceae bacterium]|nr:hypothetical protein [Gaiellaceae bacterium]